jgi:diguanylate cyclase
MPGENYEALFEHCDKALYQAKQSGRNCTVAN